MIDANPTADLQTLAGFDIPILSGPDYTPFGRTIEASAQVPINTPGPGGVKFIPTLPLAASVLTEFAKLFGKLDFPAQQEISQTLGFLPNMSLQDVIDVEIRYLNYLQGRDEKLLDTLSGIMNLTK